MQVTGSRVFALSDSGRVYVIPAGQTASASASASAKQGLAPAGTPTFSSSSTSRWLWGDDAGAAQAEYAEIVPAQKLAWGER